MSAGPARRKSQDPPDEGGGHSLGAGLGSSNSAAVQNTAKAPAWRRFWSQSTSVQVVPSAARSAVTGPTVHPCGIWIKVRVAFRLAGSGSPGIWNRLFIGHSLTRFREGKSSPQISGSSWILSAANARAMKRKSSLFFGAIRGTSDINSTGADSECSRRLFLRMISPSEHQIMPLCATASASGRARSNAPFWGRARPQATPGNSD